MYACFFLLCIFCPYEMPAANVAIIAMMTIGVMDSKCKYTHYFRIRAKGNTAAKSRKPLRR